MELFLALCLWKKLFIQKFDESKLQNLFLDLLMWNKFWLIIRTCDFSLIFSMNVLCLTFVSMYTVLQSLTAVTMQRVKLRKMALKCFNWPAKSGYRYISDTAVIVHVFMR